MTPYKIPKQIEVTTASAGMSAIWGIGIGRQVAIFRSTPASSTDYNIPAPNGKGDAPKNASGGYDKTPQWDGKMSSSLMGMPVLCYLKFVGKTYLDYQGNSITVPDITLETVLINLTQNRKQKDTEVLGRVGDITEFIGLGDWDVEITAAITCDAPVNDTVQKKSQMNAYPYDNMSEIWKLLQAPISVEVDCKYLNQFGIRYLKIQQGVQLGQVEGEYSTQRITIPCRSDLPLIIKIGNA